MAAARKVSPAPSSTVEPSLVQAVGELADGGGLSGAVHADDENDVRAHFGRRRRSVLARDGVEDGEQVVFERVAQVGGIASGVALGGLAHGVEQFARGAHAEIGGEQGVFEAARAVPGRAAVAAEKAFDARGDLRARLADGLLQPIEQRRLASVLSLPNRENMEWRDDSARMAILAEAAAVRGERGRQIRLERRSEWQWSGGESCRPARRRRARRRRATSNLLPDFLRMMRQSIFQLHGGLVGAVGGHGVERVGDGDDARHQRDLIALQSVGIAVAVHVFVVQFDARQHVLQLRDRAHDVGALGGVLLHQFEFLGGERAGLLQHAIVHADLADVVQQGGDAQLVEVLGARGPVAGR